MGSDTFQLASAGDALITRKLVDQGDEDLDAVLDRIRASDTGVVNLEMLLHDYEGYPASNDVARFSGTYLRAPPWVLDELTEAGFDLFAAASNHTGDYSHGGMLATMRELEDRNVAYSGLGNSLAAAREPAYVDTQGGRVALISACSTVTPGTEAGEQRPSMQGRPGLAPLRLDTRYVLSVNQLEQLREISDQLGLEQMKRERKESGLPAAYDGEDDIFHLLHVSEGHDYSLEFEAGDEPHVYQEPRTEDVRALLTAIQRAPAG